MEKQSLSSTEFNHSTLSIPVSKLQRSYEKNKGNQSRGKETAKFRFRWSQLQTIKYCGFIKKNEQILSMPFKRQKQKIYNRMQKCIGSRTKKQCKSHHQKMLKRYKSITNILQKHSQMITGDIYISKDVDDHVQRQPDQIGTDSYLGTSKLKEMTMTEMEFSQEYEKRNMIPQYSVSENQQISNSQSSFEQEQYLNQIICFSSNSEQGNQLFYEEVI